MSNELELRILFNFKKGNLDIPFSYYKNITVSGEAGHLGSQEIGVSEEQITVPTDVGTVGYVLFLYDGTDSEDYVEIGSTAGVYDIKLTLARPIAVMPWNSSAIYAKATNAAVSIVWIILEA